MFALVCGCRFGFDTVASKGDAAASGNGDSIADARALDGASGGADAMGPDASPVVEPANCPDVDGNTLALYTFDTDTGTQIEDSGGVHHGILRNSAAPPLVGGPQGCGQALSFPTDVYVEIADAPEWQLPVGSIDLWVRPVANPATPYVGIVSRDANGTGLPGHMSLFQWIDPDLVVVKMQQPGDGGGGMFLCSDQPIVVGRWTHVGINFGPPQAELWIDGVLSMTDVMIDNPFSGLVTCNAADARTIEGNFNPWALGGDTGGSGEGSVSVIRPFTDGAIDHMRISDARRDFSMMAMP